MDTSHDTLQDAKPLQRIALETAANLMSEDHRAFHLFSDLPQPLQKAILDHLLSKQTELKRLQQIHQTMPLVDCGEVLGVDPHDRAPFNTIDLASREHRAPYAAWYVLLDRIDKTWPTIGAFDTSRDARSGHVYRHDPTAPTMYGLCPLHTEDCERHEENNLPLRTLISPGLLTQHLAILFAVNTCTDQAARDLTSGDQAWRCWEIQLEHKSGEGCFGLAYVEKSQEFSKSRAREQILCSETLNSCSTFCSVLATTFP